MTQPGNYFDMKKEIAVLQKKIKLVENFKDSNYADQSIVKHNSIMDIKTNNEWVKHMVNVLDGLEPEPIEIPSNVTPAERNAIKELKDNQKIIIKKADKTNVFVVMDVELSLLLLII